MRKGKNDLLAAFTTSVSRGHWRVACRRYLMLEFSRAEVPDICRQWGGQLMERCSATELEKMEMDARAWAKMVRAGESDAGTAVAQVEVTIGLLKGRADHRRLGLAGANTLEKMEMDARAWAKMVRAGESGAGTAVAQADATIGLLKGRADHRRLGLAGANTHHLINRPSVAQAHEACGPGTAVVRTEWRPLPACFC